MSVFAGNNTSPDGVVYDGTPHRMTTLADWAVILVAAGFALYFLVFLVSVSDIAPELSDSGYYLLMHRAAGQIDNQVTQMGALLKALIGEPSVIAARYFNFALLFTAPASSFWLICRALPVSSRPLLVTAIAMMLGVSNWAYFKWLLLDPSYNSLILALGTGLVGLVVPVCTGMGATDRRGRLVLAAWSALLGAALLALGLVKATTAVVFFLLFALMLPVLTLARRGITGAAYARNLATVIAGGLLSGLALMLLIWVRGTSPVRVFQTLMDGLAAGQLLSVQAYDASAAVTEFALLFKAIRIELVSIAYPTLALVAVALFARFAKPKFAAFANMLAIAALVFLAFSLSDALQDHGRMALRIWGLAFVLCPLALLTFERRGDTVLLAALAAVAPLAMVAGTSARWFTHVVLFVGASVFVFAIIGAAMPRLRVVAFGTVFVAGASLGLSAMHKAANEPYRLGGTTGQATVEIVANGERFRATPSLAEAYDSALELKRLASGLDNPSPVLVDMSGRVPTFHWITGFTLPATGWTISGYPGSNALLDWSLQRVDPAQLADAWIMIDRPRADGTRFGLSIDVLNRYLDASGVQFPDDFVPIASASINYMNADADIYVRRSTCLDIIRTNEGLADACERSNPEE